jgi:hypothetical protein
LPAGAAAAVDIGALYRRRRRRRRRSVSVMIVSVR